MDIFHNPNNINPPLKATVAPAMMWVYFSSFSTLINFTPYSTIKTTPTIVSMVVKANTNVTAMSPDVEACTIGLR